MYVYRLPCGTKEVQTQQFEKPTNKSQFYLFIYKFPFGDWYEGHRTIANGHLVDSLPWFNRFVKTMRMEPKQTRIMGCQTENIP